MACVVNYVRIVIRNENEFTVLADNFKITSGDIWDFGQTSMSPSSNRWLIFCTNSDCRIYWSLQAFPINCYFAIKELTLLFQGLWCLFCESAFNCRWSRLACSINGSNRFYVCLTFKNKPYAWNTMISHLRQVNSTLWNTEFIAQPSEHPRKENNLGTKLSCFITLKG